MSAMPCLLNRASSIGSESADSPLERAADKDHRAVVIGYGPTGQTVVRLLRENDIAPTVIELNMDAVRALQADGVNAILRAPPRTATP
jgi:CPA2 family monovalent cation:H+ antiporter-2